MRVIGTAGHVDHGKSTLVEAMTGTHPDRLKEEQEREMTIDLGFAWLRLPEGEELPDTEEVGIVDVPGHRDFIANMLAGVGGIDAALFVVAADEGVMPQTREHLAILDLLQIQGGVVALTKVDLVQDADWLDLVEEDVREALLGTVMEAAPVVRVSGRTGYGIQDLIVEIRSILAGRPARPDLGRPRLPVDRVFTIAGFGTVVTGTLSDGQLRVGEEIVILPRNLRGRVRGLQTHKRKTELSQPGGRTAVNIAGVDVGQIQRGNVIAHPGTYEITRRLDVQFRLLPDVAHPMKHNTQVKLFLGAAEIVARVRLLGSEQLDPGATGWLQLELRHPVVAVRGDRYILRRPSPGETLGGGTVVDPHPGRRHKRFTRDLIARLEALAQGTPDEVLLQAALSMGAAPVRAVVLQSHLESGIAARALQELVQRGDLVPMEDGGLEPNSDTLLVGAPYWEELSLTVRGEVQAYQEAYPLRRGMPKEELRSRMKIQPRLFSAVLRRLVQKNLLAESGPYVSIPGYEVRFAPEQERAVESLLDRFAANPTAPPSVKECQDAVGEEVYNALVDTARLVPVSSDVVFRQADYERLTSELRDVLEGSGTITVAEFRDRFKTSRRYALAFLEHLDKIGVTVRVGDARRLR